MPIAEPHRPVAGDARIEAACFVDQVPAAVGRAPQPIFIGRRGLARRGQRQQRARWRRRAPVAAAPRLRHRARDDAQRQARQARSPSRLQASSRASASSASVNRTSPTCSLDFPPKDQLPHNGDARHSSSSVDAPFLARRARQHRRPGAEKSVESSRPLRGPPIGALAKAQTFLEVSNVEDTRFSVGPESCSSPRRRGHCCAGHPDAGGGLRNQRL